MVRPTQADIAYAAGFVDGEGTIRVERAYGPSPGRLYRAYVEVSQVTPGPLNMMMDRWGGHLYLRPRKNPNHRPIFRWQIADRKAIDFVTELRPYLIVKAAQADVLIALGEIKRANAARRPYTAEELANQAALYLRATELNRRGAF